MSLESLAERCAGMFAKCYGRTPRWIAAAPGRVNLIGEHTDYNDGFVLPMAADRYTVIAADRSASREASIVSETTGDDARFALRPPIERGEPAWSNYIRGVVAGFQKRGRRVGGFDAVIDSSVPLGGGLASSAALEVAAATLFEQISGGPLEPVEKALLCQQAEHDFGGVPCGIMDQFTAVFAKQDHVLLLDCRSKTTRQIPMADPSVTVLVINTNVRHKVAESEYSKRRAQCEAAARTLKLPSLRDATLKDLTAAMPRMDAVVFRRARHVITENQRTLDAAKAIEAGDWDAVGRLMYASHTSLRDDYQVSSPELDAVVNIAQALGPTEGVIGCRMTGAGFGGSAVCLVRTDAVSRLTRKFDTAYEGCTSNHANIFPLRPGAGARILR